MLWPWKTKREAQHAYKRAQQKKGYIAKTVLFYPERPKTYHTLYKICAELGWKITNNPKSNFDTCIFFEDTTKRTVPEVLRTISKTKPVINIQSVDISKKHVDEVFEQVFGYAMSVNPETYTGACVRKSDTNAVHDGKVIECPTPREKGYVYQKLIDTKQNNGKAMDLRLHVFNGNVSIVLKRYKNPNDIFNITVDAMFADLKEVLNEKELEHIETFCTTLGIDYGELDALRDNTDGKLYIVDANNTPAGPIGPLYNNPEDYSRWFKEVAEEVKKSFLRNSNTISK